MTAATGLVVSPRFLEHVTAGGHPERPARLEAIMSGISAELTAQLQPLEFSSCSLESIYRIHERSYVERLMGACATEQEYIDSYDCSICPQSFSIALDAAGAGLAAVHEIAAGRLVNAFLAVRPPGHHAERDRAMGFCFLNSIAIAAAEIIACGFAERVMIIDWDVHHGNGTQNSFYSNSKVFFTSIHQHPLSLYPGSGFSSECGAGEGLGMTLNLPMPPRATGEDYRRAFAKVQEAAESFKPQWLLLSAGFDAHREDAISQICLEDGDFAWLTEECLAIAARHSQGRLISFLEGGYNLEVLSRCVPAHIAQLASAA